MPGLTDMKGNPLKYTPNPVLKGKEVFKLDWTLFEADVLIAVPAASTPAAKAHVQNMCKQFFSHLDRVLKNVMNITVDKPEDVKGQLKLPLEEGKNATAGNAEQAAGPKS